MSFFKVGEKYGVNQANLMKKLGLGDTSEAGVGEVRLFEDNNRYCLKVWDGNNWTDADEGTLKVDGSAISLNKQVFKATEQGFPVSSGAAGSLEIQATNEGTPAVMSFHRPGIFATYLGLDNDNELKMGGWSIGGPYKIWTEKDLPQDKVYSGYDVTHNSSTNHIDSGHFLQGHAGPAWVTQNVTFSAPFTSVPRVFVQDNMLQGATVKVKGISLTGFVCYIYATPNDTTRIDWMAVGKK